MKNLRRVASFWALIIALYLLTRLINLLIIPIFTDEAIYSYWAQVALNDPQNRFISLEDGKQPLFIWLAAIFQGLIKDPLVATRLVSVLAGLGSIVGIYLLSRELFSEKIAKLSSILYLILPFTLLYDRLGIFDSLLTMFVIFSAYFSIRLVKNPSLENSLLTGIAIGLAVITKSSGFIFLYLLPVPLVLFNIKQKNKWITLLKWFLFAALSAFISQVIYNSLRLSNLFYLIERKNSEFIRSFPEVVEKPFALFFSNSDSIISWLISYLGFPLFALLLLGIIFGGIRKNKPVLLLTAYSVAPFLAEGLFNKVLYPRFILFYFPFIIIIIAYAAFTLLESVSKSYRKVVAAILIASLLFPLFTSFKLLTDPKNAPIANSDAGQYLNDWPAGYGVKEVVNFIEQDSKNQEVYVGTEGTFGLLPYAFQIYFFGNKNVTIQGFWPVDNEKLPQQVLDAAKQKETYFVFNENQKEIVSKDLKLIDQYQKGRGESYMRIYKVSSDETSTD